MYHSVRTSVINKIAELGEVEPNCADIICEYQLESIFIKIKKETDCVCGEFSDCEDMKGGECTNVETVYKVIFVEGSLRYSMEELTFEELSNFDIEFNPCSITCIYCDNSFDVEEIGELCC